MGRQWHSRRSVSSTGTLAPTLAYKIWLKRAAVSDAGRLGSTTTQSALVRAEIPLLLEEMLVPVCSHFVRLILRTICEIQVMAAALAVADDAVHIPSERELE